METGAITGQRLAQRFFPDKHWSQESLAKAVGCTLGESEVLWCEYEKYVCAFNTGLTRTYKAGATQVRFAVATPHPLERRHTTVKRRRVVPTMLSAPDAETLKAGGNLLESVGWGGHDQSLADAAAALEASEQELDPEKMDALRAGIRRGLSAGLLRKTTSESCPAPAGGEARAVALEQPEAVGKGEDATDETAEAAAVVAGEAEAAVVEQQAQASRGQGWRLNATGVTGATPRRCCRDAGLSQCGSIPVLVARLQVAKVALPFRLAL